MATTDAHTTLAPSSADSVGRPGRSSQQDSDSNEGVRPAWLIVVIVVALLMLAGLVMHFCLRSRRKSQNPPDRLTEPPTTYAGPVSLNAIFTDDPYGDKLVFVETPAPGPSVSTGALPPTTGSRGKPRKPADRKPELLPTGVGETTIDSLACAWSSAGRKCKRPAVTGNFCRNHACPTCKSGKSSSQGDCAKCTIYGAPDNVESDPEYGPSLAANDHFYDTVEADDQTAGNEHLYDVVEDDDRTVLNEGQVNAGPAGRGIRLSYSPLDGTQRHLKLMVADADADVYSLDSLDHYEVPVDSRDNDNGAYETPVPLSLQPVPRHGEQSSA